MPKTVKKSELENLIRECFTTVIKFPTNSETCIKFTDLTINSIYAIVYYEFSGIVCHENQFISDFEDELKKYVGESLKVTPKKEDPEKEYKKLIISIDYDIID